VDSTPPDTELEPLLARLLQLVGPARGGAGATGDAAVLSLSEARALVELLAARGIAQGELASLLGLEKSTVSRLAAGLERKGWLRRGRDEDNQRFVRLYLTPEGRAVAAQVWRAWRSQQARILGSLTAEERAGLAAGLRGLVRGLAAEGLLGDGPPVPRAAQPAGSPAAQPAGSPAAPPAGSPAGSPAGQAGP
jgi:DNA-binding MarR family transcriptional regulator